LNITYLSSDDSELLRKASKSYRGNRCVEMGIGYGSNLIELADHFGDTVGTDISLTEGFKRSKRSEANLFVADRATCFKDGTFDLVIMNPPYLPSGEIVDNTVDGGIAGFHVPMQFLKEALRVLQPLGAILILLSSETSFTYFRRFCEDNHLIVKQIMSKSVFFETLTVYEIRKQSGSDIKG
jgi:methylase of polypeptide subunit release factors